MLQDGTALSAATAERGAGARRAPSTQVTHPGDPTGVGTLPDIPDASEVLPDASRHVYLFTLSQSPNLRRSRRRSRALGYFDIFITSFPGWMYANPEQSWGGGGGSL